MANICEYHVLVKGAKNACHALFGGLPVLDGKWITAETGSDNDCTIVFWGSCKWSVDSYTGPYTGPEKLTIPEDPDEAETFGEGFWGVTLQEKSRLFGVEVWCNSVDIDDPIVIISEHYYSGESRLVRYEDMPREIAMDEYADNVGEDGVDWNMIEAMMGHLDLEAIEEITGVSVDDIKEHFDTSDDEEW